jgi:hypothetical protein
VLNLHFEFGKAGEDFARRAMLDFFVNHLLVSVNGKVITLSSDVGLGYEE